jgi:RNA polymerase sigma factor (sigma-70 family)
MSAGSALRPLVGYLQQIAAQTAHTEASDRQLLERFALRRDEEAFQTLVRQHGALVLGVCRRALRHRQDAEDCFQATFLVLARKAGAIHWHDSVAGWLHQVATRLAAEIRVRDARRRRRETEAAGLRSSTSADAVGEIGAILDEELRCLPERCRAAMIVCYLDGQTRDQAAVRLGLSLRTLERRLETARALLRRRLARRGLTLSAGLLAWGMLKEPALAVSAERCAATALAAARFVAGDMAQMPPSAAVLATTALRGLLWEKLRGPALLLLLMGVLGMGAAWWASAPADQPPQPVKAAVQADEPPNKPAPRPKLQEAATAAAVQEGLRWLVRQQLPDGGWKLDAATPNDVAATAFGLLPLLAVAEDGEPAKRFGPYANVVRAGLNRLIAVQHADGSFGGGMYAQGLATWALCDGYRLTGEANLRKPAQKALDYILDAQHDGGGWRYAPKQVGDTSVTSWHILALKRGQQAGLTVPADAFKKAALYLDRAASDNGAAYSYVPGSPPSISMTAAGLMCRQLLGWEARNPTILKGAARLQGAPPAPALVNCYYYHHATRVMQEIGGAEWEAWESAMAGVLLERQEREGSERGSWSPARDNYAQAGGRLMITSFSLMTLETCGRLTLPAVGATRKLAQEEAANCWDDLASGDYAHVKRAIERLAAGPDQAVLLLRKRLQPAVAPDAKRTARLIDDLGSDDFDTRERAFRALQALGEPAEPALRQAFMTAAPLELRRRLERLLDEIDRTATSPQWLRTIRALQVLELTATADASQLLQSLAQGAPGARLTRAAQAARDRLAQAAK